MPVRSPKAGFGGFGPPAWAAWGTLSPGGGKADFLYQGAVAWVVVEKVKRWLGLDPEDIRCALLVAFLER